MKKLMIIAILSTAFALTTACGGTEADLDVGTREQAVRSGVNLFRSPYLGGGGLRGVGTSRCSGSETSRWGDASAGGYQFVSCTMWYMSEWGPGFFTDEAGECVNGTIVSDASDNAWSLRH